MKNIFIGYLLIFFTFNLNGLDILPDFGGYILIFNGVSKLVSKSKYFEKVKMPSIIMAMYSFILWTGAFSEFDIIGSGYSNSDWIFTLDINYILLKIIDIVVMCITLSVMYNIIRGIEEIEKSESVELGSDNLMTTWKWNVITRAILWIVSETPLGIIAVIILIIAFIANVAFLVYLNKAKQEYEKIEKLQSYESE